MNNEKCWVLVGQSKQKLWWAKRRSPSEGDPCQVKFDPDFVLKRDERNRDIIGFFHTHPSGMLFPSDRDNRTMKAWCDCTGRDLCCVIQSDNEIVGYWFNGDDGLLCECEVLKFGGLFVGTTELEIEEDEEDFNETKPSDPTEGLDLVEDPNAQPIENFLPEDEKKEWKQRLQELGEENLEVELEDNKDVNTRNAPKEIRKHAYFYT